MIEAALAQAAVNFLVSKAAGGAAQALGGDTYKAAIEKLKGFFSYKFAGKTELTQVQNNPDKFVSLIAEEASKDAGFKSELEKLVTTLQDLTRASHGDSTSYTNVDSVSNINVGSVTDGNVAGRDAITGNQVSGGQNHIGGDQRGGTFR